MTLESRTKLGVYEILSLIGAGGMGEVYRARDTKLDRDVAIEVLPEEFANDEERRGRFVHEAKVVAALNHPNIVTVHSVEESGSVHFITMELVQGKTLAALIPRGGMPWNKFFEIAVPLVDAVGAAHEAGVIHRDLKPGNVIVTVDGRVKVLDFGLAKARLTVSLDDDSNMPTKPMTEVGQVVDARIHVA